MNVEGKGIGVTACQTAFGWIGIAWSEQGLVALTLPQENEAGALEKLPGPSVPAAATPPGLDLAALSDKLRRCFCGEAVVFDEVLDARVGTDFQRRVWALTRAIPRGETRSYAELARQAGSPRGARAVGQAMARNPWPVLVPCHRVLGTTGSLRGYGGGLAMKERLLAMEAE